LIGHINYINLLPFYVFLKQHQRFITKKSYPAYINDLFDKKQIDAAFISSIRSKNKHCLDAGIVAHKKVLSVLVCKGEKKYDTESNTSNILAAILDQDGEVLIGDKALKRYYQNSSNCVDLATLWYNKYKLPFVFARFCINAHPKEYQTLINMFLRSHIYIPQYILKKHTAKLGLTSTQVRKYLKLISYTITNKEKLSLAKFFRLVDKHGFNNT